jgi:hypothetical protein
MNISFNGRTLVNHFKGKPSKSQRKLPKKPVRWSGKFMVADAQGNAREAEWLPESGALMTYNEAREAALNLIDALVAMLRTEHNAPIKKITFNLMSR